MTAVRKTSLLKALGQAFENEEEAYHGDMSVDNQAGEIVLSWETGPSHWADNLANGGSLWSSEMLSGERIPWSIRKIIKRIGRAGGVLEAWSGQQIMITE